MVQKMFSIALLCASALALVSPASGQDLRAAPELNGVSLNGENLNGESLNGVSLNRLAANKLGANKLSANKLAANKLGLNGVSLNGGYGGAETPLILVRSVTLLDGARLEVTP